MMILGPFGLQLLLSVCFAAVGFGVGRRLTTPEGAPLWWPLVATVLALPSLLIAVYYLHIFDAIWYYKLRSLPWVDWLSGLSGLAFGAWGASLLSASLRSMFPALKTESSEPSEPHRQIILSFGFFSVAAAALWVCLLFAKPFLMPVSLSSLKNQWRDGVCLQTSESSCGPCAAATVLHHLGERDITEKILAAKAYTSRSGTLNWYLARALGGLGYKVHWAAPKTLAEVQVPAIIGVKVTHLGHFVALLGRDNKGRWIIGEPISGRLHLSQKAFEKRYVFRSFAMSIKKAK